MEKEYITPDYDGLSFDEQRKLDQKAYTKYYTKHFEDGALLTFNGWYGSIYHQEYINLLLRKYKLKKIEKADQ